jgi:hypothetical protein
MKKATFLFILLIFLTSLISAQNKSRRSENFVRSVENRQNPEFFELNIEGSPYLNKEWQESVIITTNDKKLEVKARYRYYDSVVEIKNKDDEDIYDLGMRYTKSIDIGNQNFIVLNYTSKEGTLKNGFFELLADGPLHLLVQYDKVITEAINNGYQNIPAKIKVRQSFFVYNQDKKEMTALKRFNKKSILPLFGNYSKKVADYAKKNKLSFKKPAGLAEIFKYYNSNSSSQIKK